MNKIGKILLELYEDRVQILYLGILGYISLLIQPYLLPSDSNVNYAIGVVAGAIVVGAVVGAVSSSRSAKKNRESAEGMAKDQAAVAAQMEAKLEKQRQIYRGMKFTNPYKELNKELI